MFLTLTESAGVDDETMKIICLISPTCISCLLQGPEGRRGGLILHSASAVGCLVETLAFMNAITVVTSCAYEPLFSAKLHRTAD